MRYIVIEILSYRHKKPYYFIKYLRFTVIPYQAGASRLLGSVHPDYGPVVAVGLGKHNDTLNTEENIDLNREAVRGAAAAGIRAVKQLGEIL